MIWYFYLKKTFTFQCRTYFCSVTKMETPGQSVKLFQVNDKDTRTMTLASFLWVFADSFEQILQIGLVLLLLTLNKYLLAGLTHYKVVEKL